MPDELAHRAVTFAVEQGERLITEAFAAAAALAQAANANLIDATTIRRAMHTKALAAPWVKVKEAITEGDTPVVAIRTVRHEAMNLLTEREESRGTCEISNAEARMEREGNRNFLRNSLLASIQA